MSAQPTPAGERRTTALPTLLRCDTARSYGTVVSYTVHDPELLAGTNLTLTGSGGTTSPHATAQGFGIVGLLAAAAVGAPIVLGDGGTGSTLLWAVVGFAAAFVAILLLVAAVVRDPFRAYRTRHGSDPRREVTEPGSWAWKLCSLAEDVASTDAWRHGAVDPDRLLPASLWSAVRTAEHAAELRDRLEADERRYVPQSVLAPARTELAAVRAELNRVEQNLREIGRIAREFDARAGRSGAGADPAGPRDGRAVDGTDAVLARAQALREMLDR